MRARPKRWLPLVVLGVLSCSHDLDALRAKRNSPDLRGGDGGNGGNGSGGRVTPRPGTGGSSGGMTDSGPDVSGPGPCEPCEALGAPAMMLELESCCRGIGNTECGIRFPQGELCLPRLVPGQADDTCPAFNQGSMQLEGCCRPDGRCGLDADPLGLGCAARDDLLAEVSPSGNPAAILCRYPCEADAECTVVPGGFVCAEDRAHTERYCARRCQGDSDCAGNFVCGLSNDLRDDRVLAICQPAIGSAQPGEDCMRAEDCAQGVCIGRAGGSGVCSQLCHDEDDCPEDRPLCADTSILTLTTMRPQTFKICRAM